MVLYPECFSNLCISSNVELYICISFSNATSSLIGRSIDGIFKINENVVFSVCFDEILTVARNIGLAKESPRLVNDVIEKLATYIEVLLLIKYYS